MNTRSPLRPGLRPRAFTLIEVLIVLTLIAMLIFFTVPGLRDVMKGSKLTSAADQIIGDLNLARQTAIKEGMPVEVRFYKFAGLGSSASDERFGAYQCYKLAQDLNEPSDYTSERIPRAVFEKVKTIPQGVVLVESKKWSTLLTEDTIKQGTERVRGIVPGQKETETKYFSFIISPEGETSLDHSGAQQWFITLVNESEFQKAANPEALQPKNFINLQVDPYTANTRRYQPN